MNMRTETKKIDGLQLAALLALFLAAPVLAAGFDNPPIRLTLRGSAEVAGSSITLADVLALESDDAGLRAQLADAVVGARTAGQTSQRIGHAQVAERLEQAGVNPGLVLLSGAASCDVHLTSAAEDESRESPVEVTRAQEAEAAAPAVAAHSLARLLRDRVQREYSAGGGDTEVQLEFEQAGSEYLELTSPPFDFAIQGGRRGKAGLREFVVSVRQDGRQQRTAHIFARVRVARAVIIARTPLGVGTYLRREDVQVERRTFEEGAEQGFASLDGLIGQRLRNFVDRGAIVGGNDLKPEPLVQRSRPVSVAGSSDSVRVQLTGVCLDNGMMGDAVRVRVGPERGPRRELRAVVTGVGTVRLLEGAHD